MVFKSICKNGEFPLDNSEKMCHHGFGFIDVAYLPMSFVTFIFVLSLLVGVLTGIYPASRATKISALDALRYE